MSFDYIDFKLVWPFVVNSGKPYDVYIGRPSKYGNPWSHLDGTLAEFKVDIRTESIEKYEQWIRSNPNMISMIKKELKGKILKCFCSPKLCHGHILAWIANFEE
jgi:hypothetical protein